MENQIKEYETTQKWFSWVYKIHDPENKAVMKLIGLGCDADANGDYKLATKYFRKAYWQQKKADKTPTIMIGGN